MRPDLVACAHGTADPAGREVIHRLVRELARQRPELRVSLGFADVDRPALPDLVDRIVAGGNQAVVVPLLLSAGYHLRVDLARTAAACAGALGPDELLADVLADRLDRAGCANVVLAAAGSSDPAALLDCELMAALLADRVGLPVDVGYVSGIGPRLGQVVRRTAGPVAVATYLLAPGTFAGLVRRIALDAGAVSCSPPLGADPRVAAVALRRYAEVPSRTRAEVAR